MALGLNWQQGKMVLYQSLPHTSTRRKRPRWNLYKKSTHLPGTEHLWLMGIHELYLCKYPKYFEEERKLLDKDFLILFPR
jgi:hypothetical protein